MPYLSDEETALRSRLAAEAAEIAAYARGATVTPLKPPQAPSLRDEILTELESLVAAIKSGEVSPCHLILAYGNDTGDTIEHEWFGYGLSLFEMIGHLQMQVTALATELNE